MAKTSKLAQSYGETKPGIFTTEFILTLLVQLAALCSALGDTLPPKWALASSSVSAGLYALSRGWAKSDIPVNRLADSPQAAPKEVSK